MTEEELKTIKKNFKEINESVSKYLPELETSLIENLKTEKEKIEIHNLASYCIFKNTALILVLKAIINTYEKFPNKNPNIITNLRDNTDFNKTKYKLDFDSIDNERFTSYLKNHIIICGNHFINTLYTKLQKHKKEMEEQMKKTVCNFVIQGFKKKKEYEDIAKYIKDECDKKFGGEFLCIIVDKYGGFGSCLKCAPGSQFLGEYENDRIILFRI